MLVNTKTVVTIVRVGMAVIKFFSAKPKYEIERDNAPRTMEGTAGDFKEAVSSVASGVVNTARKLYQARGAVKVAAAHLKLDAHLAAITSSVAILNASVEVLAKAVDIVLPAVEKLSKVLNTAFKSGCETADRVLDTVQETLTSEPVSSVLTKAKGLLTKSAEIMYGLANKAILGVKNFANSFLAPQIAW